MERENNNDRLTTRACEKTAAGKKCVRSFTSGDARLRLFKGSSPAERLLSSQHCNKGTAMALFVCLECSCVHGAAPKQLTLSPIKGGNMALTSARP